MRSVNLIAAKAVALHAPGTPAERREILAMLGLLDPDGGITPDRTTAPAHIEPVNDINPQGKNRAITVPRPDNCTTPALLADLPAPTPVTKPRPPKKLGPATACGTINGKAQHQARREEVCRACKDAANACQREWREKRAATKPALIFPESPSRARRRYYRINPNLPPRPETCGSLAGRSNHLRRGQKLCPKCAKHFADYQREKRAGRRAEKQALTVTDVPGQEKTA